MIRVASLEEVYAYGGRLPKGLLAPMAGGSLPALANYLGSASAGFPASVPVGAAVPAGELIVAAVGENASNTFTFADTAGNTYVNQGSVANSFASGAIASVLAGTALSTSSHINVTSSGGSSGVGSGIAASFTGVSGAAYAATCVEFQTSGSSGYTNTISTSASVRASDLVAAFIYTPAAHAFLLSPATGWTRAGSDGSTIALDYQVPASTGVVSYVFQYSGASHPFVVGLVAFHHTANSLTMLV